MSMSIKFIPFFDLQSNPHLFQLQTLASLRLFAQYYQKYYGDNYQDFSFVIMNGEKFVGYVLCALVKDEITTPDGGVEIVFSEDVKFEEQKKIYCQILDHIWCEAKNFVFKSIVIKDTLPSGSLSTFGEILFNQRFESKLTFEMDLPFLSFSESTFHASLRKSYKSFINWGKKSLKWRL